jgi:hypothetical protein
MKFLTILSLLSVFHVACKQQEVPVPECECANLSTSLQYGTQEGTIIFPRISHPLVSYIILPQNDFVGLGRIRYQLCTDSALYKQIQTKQIKDSSTVIMTEVGGFPIGFCNILYQLTNINEQADEPYPRIRVKTIDKK